MPVRLATIFGAHDEVYFQSIEDMQKDPGDGAPPGDGPYKFGPFGQYDKARIDRVLLRYAKSPLEEIGPRLPSLPEPERALLFEQAKGASAIWEPPNCSSIVGMAMIQDHPDVSYEFWRIAIQSRNPDLGDAKIDELWKTISPVAFTQIMRICLELGDPKALLALRRTSVDPETGEPDLALDARERTLLQQQCDVQEKLSALRSPLRWIAPSSCTTS